MKIQLLTVIIFLLFFTMLNAQNTGILVNQGPPTDPAPDEGPGLEREKTLYVESSADFQAKQFGFDYFPLKTKTLYRSDSNAEKTEAEVIPEDEQLVLAFQAGSIIYEQSFFKRADGIYLTRTKSGAFLFFGTTVIYPEPVL